MHDVETNIRNITGIMWTTTFGCGDVIRDHLDKVTESKFRAF